MRPLALSVAFVLSIAIPIAWGALTAPEPELLAGAEPAGLQVADTHAIAAIPDLMAEGIFRQIEYLYDISFSPDGNWMAFVLDAIPDKARMHRYYVYLLQRTGENRSLMLTTKAGPALSRSFVWLGDHTPLLCSPEFKSPANASPEQPGPTGASIQIRGMDPKLSPDGGRVVFRQGDEEDASLWLADLQSLEPRQLAASASPFGDFAWSPDGSRVAFLAPSKSVDGDSLWLVVPDESPSEALALSVTRFAWSPNGDVLAALSDAGEIHVMEIGGGSWPVAEAARDFTWSPDGQLLAYIAEAPTGSAEAVHVRSLVTGKDWIAMQGKAAEGWDFGAVHFSPDGGRVYARAAAGRDVSGDGQYFDKSDRVMLWASTEPGATASEVPIAGSVQQPALAAGGRLMAVTVENAGKSSLWCIDLANGQAASMGDVPVQKYAYGLAWASDGANLAFEDQGNLMLSTVARK